MTRPVWTQLGEGGTLIGVSDATFTSANAPAAVSPQRWIALTIDGVEGYIPWFSTGTPTGETAAGASGLLRNNLLNGNFEVWQRGTSIAVAAGISTTAGYAPDRWCLLTGANQASVVAQAAGLGATSQNAAKVQRNSAQTGIGVMMFEQTFDLSNIVPMRGKVVSLSFTAKAGANWSPASGALTCAVYCGTGSAARRGAGAFTTETTPLTATNNITTSAVRYTASSTAIPTGTTQLSVVFSWTPVGTAGNDDSFTLDEVQLEIASAASAFEVLPFDLNLRLCQRYYAKSFNYGTAPAQNAGTGTGENVSAQAVGASTGCAYGYTFPTRMRTVSAVTLYNPAAANAEMRNINGNTDHSATTVQNWGDMGFYLNATSPGGSAAGSKAAIHWVANAEI